MLPTKNMGDHSVPENGKQIKEYENSENCYNFHKALPHLAGRRKYVTTDEASNNGLSTVNNIKKSPKFQNQVKKPEEIVKSDSGLDSVPRPNVIGIENTMKGIRYIAKYQIPIIIPSPSSITRYYSPDEGNSIPRLFRVSTQLVYSDGPYFLKDSGLPFGAIAQPFADLSEYEEPIPISKFGGEELVRCLRCGSYINPGFEIFNNGMFVKCNICEGISQLKSPIVGSGEVRPELKYGTYDFIAPKALKGKKVSGNNLLFVIDWTQNSIATGNCLQNL